MPTLSGITKVIDVANLLVAITSLLIAIVAHRISKKVAITSITTPFVLEQLYNLYVELEHRPLL